jgi:UDP:flavonoid glycosyltransferase YjiC (YdhE family)
VAHLWLALSAHGYGHAGQVAPLVAELRARHPGLRLTVETALPRELLERRFVPPPFEHVARPADVGMVMHDALAVDVVASCAAYRDAHRERGRWLEEATAVLRRAAPDLLLADVPYLPLVAAARAAVPAVALCSLHWAAIHAAYCDAPGDADVRRAMLDAYRGAERFYRPAPAMAMPELPNVVDVGPLATLGRERRERLRRALGVDSGERVVLVALGGVPTRLPLAAWPRLPGVHWLVQADWGARRDDIHPFEPLGLPFVDLLASSDALLAKPGYGLFAEAACHGVPVLALPREDWPESAALLAWLQAHGRCVEVDRAQADAGDLGEALARAWALPTPPRPVPDGAATVSDDLARWLA